MRKILLKSIFSWNHFITGYETIPKNYCIYCGDDFKRSEPCFWGNWLKRFWRAFGYF